MPADPLASRAKRSPDGLALVDRGDGLRLTWASLDAMASTWAGRLSMAGVVKGERVAVVEHAGARFAAILHGCIRIGAVMVPLPVRSMESERERLIDAARPRAVVRAGEIEMRQAGVRAIGDLCLLHTSGTMGPPKPVRLTLDNHRAAAAGCAEALGRRRGDKWMLMLEPHQAAGFAIFMRSVLHGQPVVSVPGFEVGAVVSALADEEPSLIVAVPSMLTRLLEAGAIDQLRRPRAILLVGSAVTKEHVLEWANQSLNVCPTYGMTETCSHISTVPPGRSVELAGTAGLVHSGAQVTIQDGVIVVSGDVVSPSVQSRFITGDVGHVDERGALVVTGRRDELIITGGEKVRPEEVEAVLRSHPTVRDAAVVGRPDRIYGHVIEAVVVPEGASTTEDSIAEWCREHLSAFKVPRRIRFVESLPRTEAGKLLRAEL